MRVRSNPNCKFSGFNGECHNVNVKHSFFGLGMRVCKLTFNSSKPCEFMRAHVKPTPPSGPPDISAKISIK